MSIFTTTPPSCEFVDCYKMITQVLVFNEIKTVRHSDRVSDNDIKNLAFIIHFFVNDKC